MRRLLAVSAICLCFPAATSAAETGGVEARGAEAQGGIDSAVAEASRTVVVRPHHPAVFRIAVEPAEVLVWIDGLEAPLDEETLTFEHSTLVVLDNCSGSVVVKAYSQHGRHRVRAWARWTL